MRQLLSIVVFLLYLETNQSYAENEENEIAWALDEIRIFHQKQFPKANRACIDLKTMKLLVHEKRKDFLSRFIFDFEYPFYLVQDKTKLIKRLESLAKFVQKKKRSFKRIEIISAKLVQQLKKKPQLSRPSPYSDHLSFFYEQARTQGKFIEIYWEARRINDLHRWMLFELEVLEKNREILTSFAKNRLDGVWRRGIIAYPGGNGILTRSRDFAEIQRQLQDTMKMEETEKIFLLQKTSGIEAHAVSFAQRALFFRLCKEFKQTPVEGWLRKSLKKPYDLSYLNHVFWRYRQENLTNEMIRLIKAYLKRPNPTRIGLLEILFYRNGAVHTSHFARDRFIPEIWRYAEQLSAELSIKELYIQAAKFTGEITSPMSYGTSNTLRFAFKEEIVDCIRSSNICGAILANAGVPHIYPVFISKGGGTHALSCIKAEDGFFAIDTGSGSSYLFSFPGYNSRKRQAKFNLPENVRKNLRGRAISLEENYYHGLASWVNWKISLNYETNLVEMEIPYLPKKGKE